MKSIINDFLKTDLFKVSCYVFFFVIIVGVCKWVMTNDLQNFSSFGSFVGGILSPLFGLFTILILIGDRIETRERVRFDNAYRILERYSKILEDFESELVYSSEDLTDEYGPEVVGFDLIFIITKYPLSYITAQDKIYMFTWINKYISTLNLLYVSISKISELKSVFHAQFLTKLELLNEVLIKYDGIDPNTIPEQIKIQLNQSKPKLELIKN